MIARYKMVTQMTLLYENIFTKFKGCSNDN